MSETLKPCPFCGGEAVLEEVSTETPTTFSVGCNSDTEPNCMGYQSLTTFARRCDAITAWNTRAEKPGEWLPIASAPKDGTVILVARHMGSFGWIRGYAHWEDFRGISGWISNGLHEPYGNLGLAEPSLWQPLPPAPETTGER